MSAFEIVRGDAGWHARVQADNGKIIAHTETYKRRRGALVALAVIVEASGGSCNRPPTERKLYRSAWFRRYEYVDQRGVPYSFAVWEVDERTTS